MRYFFASVVCVCVFFFTHSFFGVDDASPNLYIYTIRPIYSEYMDGRAVLEPTL